MTDHYATLGVPRSATAEDIKRAFRKLASQHHPDRGGDTQRFQEIQAAYDTLGDPTKRAAYDNPQPQFHNFSHNASFNNINDIFAQMFGGQSPFGHHPRRNHVRMTLWITLLDVARGGSRPVALGTHAGQNTVEIEIPQGINDGDNVQYSGIAPGGQDLVVQFRVQPHPRFRRDALNLHADQKVSVWKMIVGGDVEIDNLEGARLQITIPANTQPGTVMRLRSQGLRDRSGNRGDLMLRIEPEIPTTIHPDLLAAIREHG